MNSYATLGDARVAAGQRTDVETIIEIEPGLDGVHPYILSRCGIGTLKIALSRKPMREIKRLIAAHPVDPVGPAHEEALAEDRARDLARNVPGLEEVRTARSVLSAAREKNEKAFARMMDTGSGHLPAKVDEEGPRQVLVDLKGKFPRAALYLRAESQSDSSHWADNTGKGGAGRRAMEIIAGGGSLADAEAAVAVRRECTD